MIEFKVEVPHNMYFSDWVLVKMKEYGKWDGEKALTDKLEVEGGPGKCISAKLMGVKWLSHTYERWVNSMGLNYYTTLKKSKYVWKLTWYADFEV